MSQVQNAAEQINCLDHQIGLLEAVEEVLDKRGPEGLKRLIAVEVPACRDFRDELSGQLKDEGTA